MNRNIKIGILEIRFRECQEILADLPSNENTFDRIRKRMQSIKDELVALGQNHAFYIIK